VVSVVSSLSVKKNPGTKGQPNTAHNKVSVDPAHEALIRLQTMAGAGAPLELQELALHFEKLRSKNRNAALAAILVGRSITSVRATERVAAFMREHGLTPRTMATRTLAEHKYVSERTIRDLLKDKKGTLRTWTRLAGVLGITLEQLLDIEL
jgi:hypothetical protein